MADCAKPLCTCFQGLAQLPLPVALESALLSWLWAAAADGRLAGAQLPLFLLQRGALADAAAASATLDEALASGSFLCRCPKPCSPAISWNSLSPQPCSLLCAGPAGCWALLPLKGQQQSDVALCPAV